MSDQPDKTATVPAPAPAPAPAAEPQTQTADKKPEESQPETNDKPTEQPAATTETTAPESTTPAPAAAEEPTNTTTTDTKEEAPEKPAYFKNNPGLATFFERLPAIIKNAEHSEMWGVQLVDNDASHAPTINILIKYLRANEGNVKLGEEQLTNALKWRKSMDPVALAESGVYDAGKFAGLGYLTNYTEASGKDVVVTWNIYGGVKDLGKTFGDMDEFLKWRVALMELAVKDLKLGEATSIMDYNGEDPYQMVQVHDYLNVSFLRMNPNVKAATKKTIEVFAMAYPELLREKFFVNVPALMGWMFTAMKVFLSKNTTRKFHPITNGVNLAREFPSLVDKFPKAYGGKSEELQKSARTVNLTAPAEDSKPEAGKEEPAKEAEAPKDESKEAPKEESKEAPKEENKEAPKEAKGEATELPANAETSAAN